MFWPFDPFKDRRCTKGQNICLQCVLCFILLTFTFNMITCRKKWPFDPTPGAPTISTWVGHCQGQNLNKLGRGLLGDATYYTRGLWKCITIFLDIHMQICVPLNIDLICGRVLIFLCGLLSVSDDTTIQNCFRHKSVHLRLPHFFYLQYSCCYGSMGRSKLQVVQNLIIADSCIAIHLRA